MMNKEIEGGNAKNLMMNLENLSEIYRFYPFHLEILEERKYYDWGYMQGRISYIYSP